MAASCPRLAFAEILGELQKAVTFVAASRVKPWSSPGSIRGHRATSPVRSFSLSVNVNTFRSKEQYLEELVHFL